jgi:apolipoprotein N-acyltransferase
MLFLACFIFKIRATLDFKVKYLRLRAHKLISPSYLGTETKHKRAYKMWKDKLMWGSIGLGLACFGLAYWQAGIMGQLAEREEIWHFESLWFLVFGWLGCLLLFGRFMTSLPERRKMIVGASASGVLFWSGFMPNYLVLAPFVGFVPLLWIEDRISSERATWRTSFWTVFKFAFIAFFMFNLLSTYWVLNTGFVAGMLANVLNAILMSIPFVLYHVVKKQHNEKIGMLAFVVLWLAFEWWHFYWALSWPWLALGHSFAHLPQLIQWYEWLGVSGGSLWILLANVYIWQNYKAWQAAETKPQIWSLAMLRTYTMRPLIIVFLPMLVSLVRYFTYSEGGERNTEVALVQPNYEPHYEKFRIRENVQLGRFLELSQGIITPNTAFLVYPETSFNSIELDKLTADNSIIALRKLVDANPKTTLISGISAYYIYPDAAKAPPSATRKCRKDGSSCIAYSSYNSGVQIRANNDSIALYHKSKLVPGSETMPYVGEMAFFQKLILDLGGASGQGLATQPKRSVFTSNNGIIAPIICYESAYGEYVTEYTRLGAQALFVMTNDGWWGDTYGYRQHKYMSVLRAIENRRWVARAANTGTTCFINSRGDIIKATEYGVATAISDEIALLDGKTFFVQWGDLVGRISLLLTLVVLVSTVSKWVTPTKAKVAQMRKDNDL